MGCPERELASHLGGFDELRIGIQSPTTCGVSNVPLSYTPHQALDKHQPLFFCFFWGPLFFTMYIHTYMIMHLFYLFIF